MSVNYANSAGSASTVTVNNSDSNTTYRMVWHSGNTLYSTGGIYCNPSTDAMYASFMELSRTTDHGLRVGSIRGTAVGSRTGQYIHMYERVHIGSPNGWGSNDAPSYGLSTYGGAWLAVNSGSVGIGTSSPSYKLHVIGDVYANGGWLRSSGSTGWYNESYGGGWYMTDSTWVRSYNGKGVVAGGFYHSSYGSANYLLTSNGGAWAVHTGRNNEANKIVRTDGNGFVQAGYINTSVSTEDTLSCSRLFFEHNNDGYIRKMSVDRFKSLLMNPTYLQKLRRANLNITTSDTGMIPPDILGLRNGYPLYTDPEFASGTNGISVYNNSGGSAVTITRESSSTSGNSSGYCLHIHSAASGASPYGGGFYFATSGVKARTYICIFRAVIPTGYSVVFHTNSVGSGGNYGWLTSNDGTGKYEWYAYMVQFGTSPSSTFFFTLDRAAAVDWYLSYANVINVSNTSYDGLRTRYADYATDSNMVDGQHFSYSNDSNSPTYLWATNNNGSSFLAARGSISVNYANSAGSATKDSAGNTISSYYLPLSGGTMTGPIRSDSGYVILNPIGASYHTTTGTVTGCITINLPASLGNTMVSMWIDVYIYEQQKSFSVHCGGYTYSNSTWQHSPFAIVYGANHRVRLGHNGTQFVVYIGETNTTWSYPQVSVRNVTLGYSPTLANWAKAWSVSFSTSVSNVTYDTTTYAWTTKNLSKSEFATASHNHDSTYVKYAKVSKSTADSTNAYPYIYNVENETVVSGYYAYWYILNFGKYSGGNYVTQLAMPYQDSLTDSELFIRSAKGSTWRTWRRVLHSNNYTEYTVKKDGTGASGTWGINISGNADTVDGQHFNWNNNKNDHTYLWAASSNGQAYLVHRASMSVNYANTASGLDLNRTSITTGAAGWYKLAYYASTDPRGSVRIGLITTGGSFVPFYAELYVENGWGIINMVLYGRFDYISKFRFTSDSANCYIEGYFPNANTEITLQKIKGISYVSDYTSGWNLYTTATPGSGTVQDSENTRSSLSSGLYTNRSIEGNGFVKSGSSDSYVLLGGGGHKAESSLSVNYASSASSATIASTVTVNSSDANSTYRMVWHSGNTLYGTGGIYCNPSTDYVYANSFNCGDWFRSTGTSGWYNPTNNCHVYPNSTTSYGGLMLRGEKGGYTGFILGSNSNYMNLMDNGTDKGLYQEGKLWILYYNRSNNYVGIRTSSLSYPLTISGDSYTNGWSRSASGFHCEGTGVHYTHQGSIGEIDMTSNNEFLWGSSSSTLYFNYRGVSRGTTVTNYIWNAGSSTSWASHNMGNIWLNGSGVYLRIGPQNGSHAHYETNAATSHWFNKRVDVNGAIWRYNTNYGISSDGYFYAKGVYANRDGSSTYGGISLYSTSDPITEYGIAFRGTGNYGKIGRVQGDWATYFTMDSSHNRGWIFRSGGTNYASVSARGEAYFSAVGTDNYIAYPSGGFFSSDGSTGYIIITIPASYKSRTMMRFNVEIYNYSGGTSTTYTIGGYNYSDGNWYNVFAYANRQGTTGYGNLTVRFGHNGTNSIIWIGESNTSYSYPKVRITNVTLGHSTTDYNTWAAGWSVTIATTAPTNVSQTVTNPATNYYAQSAGNADTVDGQHFNWNNNKNDHTYLWAASSNGQAYLVHRASMSVNYANSAGSASTVTVNSSDANSTYRMVWHSGNTLYGTGGIYCNPYTDYLYASSMQTSNWFRSTGNTGWYNESYGGGWYMTDSTWVRSYNGKGVVAGGFYHSSYGSTDYVLTSNGGVWAVHTGRNNEANKIVRTDVNGYIQAGWINTTSGDMGTTAATRVYCSDDGYIRYKSLNNFSSDVAGNLYWANVNVSTSSSTATYPTFGNLAVINDSSNSGYDALAYFRNHADHDWAVIISANNYGLDIRKNSGGSYSLRNAGNSRLIGSTIIGADASPSYTLDVRGKIRATDRIYANEWIQFDNASGLYWPNNNGAHLYANNVTTYAGLITQGSRGGYCGLQCGPSTTYMTVMSTDTHHGLFCENTGTWEFYYNRGNDGVGIRTSSITKNFNVNGQSYLSSNVWIGTTSGGEMLNVGGWVGTTGNTGWYNSTYAGGIYMSDSTYIRVYNDKRFYNSNTSQYAFYTSGGMTALGHMYSNSSACSWIAGQNSTNAALNIGDATDTGSYWPWFRQTNTSSAKWFSVGTLNNSLYFIGSATSRTENSYDYGFRMDFSNGYLYGNFSGYLSGTASSATTATQLSSSAGSATNPIYFSGGKPAACSFNLNATVSAGTASKLAYYSAAHTISAYTDTKGSSVTPIYLNGGIPTACTGVRFNQYNHNRSTGYAGYVSGTLALSEANVLSNQIYILYNGATLKLPTPSNNLVGVIVFVKNGAGSNSKVYGNITNADKVIESTANKTLTLSSNQSAFFICMKYGSYSSWVYFYCG